MKLFKLSLRRNMTCWKVQTWYWKEKPNAAQVRETMYLWSILEETDKILTQSQISDLADKLQTRNVATTKNEFWKASLIEIKTED